MQTVIQRPRILFVDGLSGSGKSTAAKEVGRRCPESRVFLEMHPNHPLLVGVSDRMGAAFGTIHQVHTADSFAAMALQKLDAFLETAGPDERYVFESHPLQSTVRVLLQLDAPEPAMLKPMLALAARPESYEGRTNALIDWVTACGASRCV